MLDPFGAVGRGVAVPLGALAALRGGKPMHPRGAVYDAVLERHGSQPPWRVPWLDEAATEPAVVRLSRGAGLPAAWPDLLGLAVRVPAGQVSVDLLLSTTGVGPLLRRVPLLRRDAAVPYTSIMGYRTGAGTVQIAALPAFRTLSAEPADAAHEIRRHGSVFVLAAARGTGAWRPFGRLTLTAPREPVDPDVRFDAVRRPPPGLRADGPMARFRAPAYARAQAERRPRPVTPSD